MDIKRLEIFLKILESKSLSKTAAALGMAQPSISAALKALEDALGHRLFDRTPRSVKALPEALILAPYARRVLETLGEAAWALGSRTGGPRESLAVGASSVPAAAIVPPALRSFKALYPKAHIKLKTGESENIIERVRDGEFDIGLVGLRHISPELSGEIIAHDELGLLAAGELCEAMGAPPQSLEDIAAWPLIMREDGSGTKAAFLKAFAKRPDLLPQLNIAAEAFGLFPALSLARAGLGAVVISGLTGRAPWLLEGMKLMPLKFMGGGRNFYLIRRKAHKPSPLLKALINIIKTPQGGHEKGNSVYSGK